MAPESSERPAVHVGPGTDPLIEAAVLSGGGRLVDLEHAEVVVCFGEDTPEDVAAMVRPGVRWVQLRHAGVESFVDAGLITQDPVWTSAAGAFAPQVAEHALALMLAGARSLPAYARAQTWTGRETSLFAGSTVAMIGAGGIGRELVALLEPFGCRVLAVSGSGPFPGAERTVTRADYRDVLAEADFVVVLAPSTPQTQGMIGARELALMKPSAWLVNVARGPLVVTDDLVDALHEGRIAGAALDVTDPEPLPDGHPLWSEPRAIITPHAANPVEANAARLAERVEENVRRWVVGEPLLAVVDPVAGF